jgi:ATP-binding cassette subfamily B protein
MAIARAIMKKPEVYIFDDSFSALDMKTDKELRANLKEAMGNDATMIVVAQRVGTIIDATRIIVLDNGKAVGIGTHKELLKNCQLYREIAEIQLGKEVVENEIRSA